ncbi:MAG: FliI/YscN family ATPase [Burkholderiaceae bacterium]
MSRQAKWAELLDNAQTLAGEAHPLHVRGRLARVSGMTVEARGIRLPVGSVCNIEADELGAIDAEVLGFNEGHLMLMPTQSTNGLSPGVPVAALEPAVRRPRLGHPSHGWNRRSDQSRHLPIGPGLLGRIVDATGAAMDHQGELAQTQNKPIRGRQINAMDRTPIKSALDTGVRAINSMLTVGRGQRIGLFAGAGVGKSILLGMMARNTDADIVVVGLIGERGREVREFVDEILGASGRQRAAVVVAPADEPPLLKIQAAEYACAIAEYFRDQGLNVLLLMDSLTRYAMALREVSLAMGEAPATRGYPASVFTRLPQLVERAGNSTAANGSITALYTVLLEGDDLNDPVGDSARSHLDGHIVLSRELADSGHFPAISIDSSVSRVMPAVADTEHQLAARSLRRAWSAYQQNRELITLGAYNPGSDPLLDRTIAAWPDIVDFVTQGMDDKSGILNDIEHLKSIATLLDTELAPQGQVEGAGQ